MEYKREGSWDARAYDKVSLSVQYQWGLQVVEWRKWQGDEIVMDAGCGTGLLTKELAKKVPRGKVYAVDIDNNMLEQARTNLRSFINVEIVNSSFIDVKLPRKLDVIFSNSAFHWVKDHRKAFQEFWFMLKETKFNENGGNNVNGSYRRTSSKSGTGNRSSRSAQLLIQCGAYGNLQNIITILDKIANSHRFRHYFIKWNKPWHFANPEETDKLLDELGYVSRNVYSMNDYIVLPNRDMYYEFIKTVVMKSYLDHLSISNDKEGETLKVQFFDAFMHEIEKSGNKPNEQWRLDFVRLNIAAYKP